ncbi:MAG: peptidylprolyl isomerase [Neisseriaceae bacterium]
MFNIVEKHQKLVKGIMIVIIASFVLWGIGSYIGMVGDDGYIAKVGDSKIYERDIDNVMQQNKQYTDKMQVLFSLINRQLIIDNANNYNLTATTKQLQNEISNIPAFQESGSFAVNKYKEFLSNSGQTASQFQNSVQQQIVINQFVNVFKDTYFNSNAFNDKFAQLLSRERNVSTYTIDPKTFYSKITINDKQINDYYKQNIAQFTIPEQVKVQYIKLSPDTLQNNIKISESAVSSYINAHESELSNTKVDVSHILFSVPSNADAKTKSNIKALAKKVLDEVKANPSKFSELAKEYSQDPGSAKNGGDLGFFGQGTMVAPFEKVAFSLKPNEISDLVETQFGYHILKLNAKKEASLSEVRDSAITQLKKQQANSLIAKDVDILNDLTYNKPTTLEPAAKALGLTIQTSNWIKKGTTTADEFANPKVQKAIFSDDTIKKHNNSELVDLGNNIYVVYHVVDHKPLEVEPISTVKDTIINNLKQQQAIQMANKYAQDTITKLLSGKLTLNFTGSVNVSLTSQTPNISSMGVKQIFSTNITKLPAYTFSPNQQSQITIYKINRESINQSMVIQNKKLLEEYNKNNAMLDFGVYVASLKTKFPVSYKAEKLTQSVNGNVSIQK